MNKDIHIGAKLTTPGSSKDYKTGTWRHQTPMVDKSKCKDCLLCVQHCPENCIKAKYDEMSHIDYNYCKGCGICAYECPNKAITMKKND